MIKLKKYLLLAFLIENIFTQTAFMHWVSDVLFYPFVILGVIFMLSPSFWDRTKIARFLPLYLLMAVYVVYEFTFGIDFVNIRTITYLVGKIATFGIIIEGIDTNESFYRTKGVFILIVSMAFVLAYGLASGSALTSGDGRSMAGFTNANQTGAMSALIIGMLLFYLRNKRWKSLYIFIFALGAFGVLASGSRAGFLMLFLLIFLRFGVNLKTVGAIALIFVLGLFIFPAIGIHTVGINRLIDTYEGREGTNREYERLATEMMISEKPITGWGYLAENQGEAAMIAKLPSHNGYLEVTKQMGYPCAILYFLIIGITLLRYQILRTKHKMPITLFYAVLLTLLIRANYENGFTGIHEIGTNIFFWALAIVSDKSHSLKNTRNKFC